MSAANIKANIKYRNDPSVLSDVCLFSSYSFSGKVEEYVYYYLEQLQKAGFSIVFISTSVLDEACVLRLSHYAFFIIERENKCPDFGSWKTALSMLNWGRNLDAVLLVNDSVFGPLFDLGSIITSMKEKYDIWGMTDSYEVEYHLQSYFLYFNKAAVASELFTTFWKKVNLSATKDQVIFLYEVGLSTLFNQSKFSLGAYAAIDMLTQNTVHGHRIINPMLVFWKTMIEKHHFPFLKRELIIKLNISKTYWNIDLYIHVGRWKRIIEDNTTYPVTLINKFIDSYYEAIQTSNINIVLRKRKMLVLSPPGERSEAQRVLISFLQWLKSETDIEIEILICDEEFNKSESEFAKFGAVTNFQTLSETEKRHLKERLIDEIAIVFSNSTRNISVQKYLSFLDVPQVVYVHELSAEMKHLLSANKNQEWMRNNVTCFIAGAEIIKQNLIEDFKVPETQVQLVYPFINQHGADQFEKQSATLRSDLGIPSNAFVVGMDNTGDWQQSTDLLSVIAASICKDDNDIHIIWLGMDTNNLMYDLICFDLRKTGFTGRVHLLAKEADRSLYFNVFDVFIMASREAAFPLVNLESGLAGKPVICFENSGGSAEYVLSGTGYKVPYLDIVALSEKVFKYYNNRLLAVTEKENIQQIVKENYTTSVQAPKIFKLLCNYYDKEERMFTEDPPVAFMVHIYYENSWEEIKNKLRNFDTGRNYFLFSISEACLIKEKIIADINKSFKNAFSLITSNIGKDIGGKMALIDLYLLLNIKSSYIVFLHDKQSPHSATGESWKNVLFKIIDPNNQRLILSHFKDPKVGIVGAKDHIINEYDASTGNFRNNNLISKRLLAQFNIAIENYDFLGGSMYWLRSSIIENFFRDNHPLLMRENLEHGNVLDIHEERLAHTWERMFSWIVTNEGFTIKGI